MSEPVRRRRREPDAGEFTDPLQKFGSVVPNDKLEEALFTHPVTEIQITPFKLFPPDLKIFEAIKLMAEGDYFCLLIGDEEGRLLGLFTERDVLMRVADRLEEMGDRPISEVMTPEPLTIYETDTPAKALNMMAEGGFRHIPVLDVDNKVVGIIGPQRLARYLFAHMED